jgi:hypothetical protein
MFSFREIANAIVLLACLGRDILLIQESLHHASVYTSSQTNQGLESSIYDCSLRRDVFIRT